VPRECQTPNAVLFLASPEACHSLTGLTERILCGGRRRSLAGTQVSSGVWARSAASHGFSAARAIWVHGFSEAWALAIMVYVLISKYRNQASRFSTVSQRGCHNEVQIFRHDIPIAGGDDCSPQREIGTLLINIPMMYLCSKTRGCATTSWNVGQGLNYRLQGLE
jgi:hypothetical protein